MAVTTTYLMVFRRPGSKQETTIQDLVDQSKARVPGNNAPRTTLTNPPTSPSANSPVLQSVPANTQSTIRNEGAKATFITLTPTKMPENFSLSPSSLGSATENGVEAFGLAFEDTKANMVSVRQYNYQDYLQVNNLTANQFLSGTKSVEVSGQNVYLGEPYTINSPRFQYVQGATLVRGNTLIKISYYNTVKISDTSLAELAASFVK